MQKMRPEQLESRLRVVYRREQSLSLLLGLLALCAWTIALFLVLFAIDWLIRLPMLLRMITFVLLLGLPLYKAWRSGWCTLESFSLARCALKAETHYKNLDSLLVTGVQLCSGTTGSGTSRAMAQRTVELADQAAHRVEPGQVVPFRGLGNPFATSGVLCSVIVIFALVNLPLLSTAAARIFMPWLAIDYPTRTNLELEQEEIVVKEGDGVAIRALITGQVPDKARLSIRTGQGAPRKRSLPIQDGTCEYEMAAVYRSFDYSIRASDADSGWHSVKVIKAPQVAHAEIRVRYPDYMNRPVDTRESMTLTVPEGARLEWNLTLDRPVRDATFRIGSQEPVTLELSDDGLSVRHQIDALASDSYSDRKSVV